MSYVGIDTQGARALGQVLQDTASRVEGVRSSVTAALDLADLASQVPAQLGQVQDGFTALATGVTDKAALAEQYTLDPQGTAASLGAPVDTLGAAISGLLGFAGPADLRQVLAGLPAPGADPALDGALDRLNPVLLPALLAGQRPELTEAQAADLTLLALALGIEHAGPPVVPVAPVTEEEHSGFFWRVRAAAQPGKRTGTEVFWNDFWADGRTVEGVLADPAQLLEWVAGTFELDHRLALATGLPTLADVLSSVDFATTGSDPGELAAKLATAETEFAAIAGWLPAFLVGQDSTAPDATQLAQTLAFAARVGWPDPGAEAATEQDRFADAIAFLRANRALQSALLPTGFEGDTDPLAFFNGPGIGFVLDLGRRTGVLDDAVVGTIAGTVDQALASFGVDMSGPTPVELTEQLQQQLFALLSTQIPRSALEKPALQAQFVAALGYLRGAATGPEQRQRLIEVLAAFRTLVVTGAPALTERQLVAAVGQKILDVLGRSRLRLRSQAAVRKNPEFLLVARQWGLPGSKKQDLGKYKFSWSFDDLGVLTAIRRKKKSWLSRAWDTIKAVGQAIWKSWEDNPLKAIFQIGKIALGAAAFFVPGLQGLGLGAVSFALNAGEAVFHAAEGDWLGAISSGLSAFTTGVSDVFRAVPATAVELSQGQFVTSLFGESNATFDLLKNVRAAFDIGTSIFNATQADTLVGAIGAGLGAAVTTVGSGGQLLKDLNVIDKTFLQDLLRLGLTVADINRLVAPAAGLVDALDRDNLLAALGNGLSLLSAGARIVSNPKGAFSGPLPAGGILQFEKKTRDDLFELSQRTGVAAGIAKALDAAERGDRFAVGAFLAQAVQAANDPAKTEIGSRARVAGRIAEIGVLLEAVFDRKASPTQVAPLVLQRLQAVLDATNTPLKKPDARPASPTPAAGRRPLPIPPGAGVQLAPPGTPAGLGIAPLGVEPVGGLFRRLGLDPTPIPIPQVGPSPLPGAAATPLAADNATFAALPADPPAAVTEQVTEEVEEVVEAHLPPGELLTLASFEPQSGAVLFGPELQPLVEGPQDSSQGDDVLAQMSPPQADTTAARPKMLFVIIGNSFISGTGSEWKDFQTVDVPLVDLASGAPIIDPATGQQVTVPQVNPAYRSSTGPARELAAEFQRLHPEIDVEIRNVARNGATIPSLNQPFEQAAVSEEAQMQAVKGADVVFLEIGGNDIGFAKVATAVDLTPSWIFDTTSLSWIVESAETAGSEKFRGDLGRVYNDILKDMNDNGKLFVMGYPYILPEQLPSLLDSTSWWTSLATSSVEAGTVTDLIGILNGSIQIAIRRTSVPDGKQIGYVDTAGAFAGHEVTTEHPDVNGLNIPWIYSPFEGSYHPNREGNTDLWLTMSPQVMPQLDEMARRKLEEVQQDQTPQDQPHRGDIDDPTQHADFEGTGVPGLTYYVGPDITGLTADPTLAATDAFDWSGSVLSTALFQGDDAQPSGVPGITFTADDRYESNIYADLTAGSPDFTDGIAGLGFSDEAGGLTDLASLGFTADIGDLADTSYTSYTGDDFLGGSDVLVGDFSYDMNIA